MFVFVAVGFFFCCGLPVVVVLVFSDLLWASRLVFVFVAVAVGLCSLWVFFFFFAVDCQWWWWLCLWLTVQVVEIGGVIFFW